LVRFTALGSVLQLVAKIARLEVGKIEQESYLLSEADIVGFVVFVYFF
jgi:hypothetical protein